MTRLMLDEIVDTFEAKVIVEHAPDGAVTTARFDLTGLPRLDSSLIGRPVEGVPRLVERLCGICPAAHHLAGVRALESLAGAGPLRSAPAAIRALLHHGAAVLAHSPRLLSTDATDALLLREYARQVVTAAGSPSHFPKTAVPGGVTAPVSADAHAALHSGLDAAFGAAQRIAERLLTDSTRPDFFTGADAALVNETGAPDLLGSRLRVIANDGSLVVPGAAPADWEATIVEAEPGEPAPRPYLVSLGPTDGHYRVGPVAQLRVGTLTTPQAATLQSQWLAHHQGAAAARAIMTLHSVEVISQLLPSDALRGTDLGDPLTTFGGGGVGVGWVDGPRGLLVHRYATDDQGRVTAATILTPTAQNERWLADLLRHEATATGDDAVLGMEDAIREADPCLPCSSAPAGAMGLHIQTATTTPGS